MIIANLKKNWFTIRVVTASIIFSVLTFVFCYIWFNYEVKTWSLDDYNRGVTKVKFSNNPKSSSECVWALFINKRR